MQKNRADKTKQQTNLFIDVEAGENSNSNQKSAGDGKFYYINS